MLEPTYVYGSDVNRELRDRLEMAEEAKHQARKTMQEGAEAVRKLRKGNRLILNPKP